MAIRRAIAVPAVARKNARTETIANTYVLSEKKSASRLFCDHNRDLYFYQTTYDLLQRSIAFNSLLTSLARFT